MRTPKKLVRNKLFSSGRPTKIGAQRSSRQILLGARRDGTNGTANRDYAKFMICNHINIVLALELRVESISEVYCGAPKAWEPVFNGSVSLALPSEVLLASQEPCILTSIQAFATTPIAMDIHFDAFMKGLYHWNDP